jgi:3-hydroxybutyryl-CoA dehydrogenase
MAIEDVFVAGAGFMGSGIAQAAAAAGCRVTLYDLSEERLAAGRASISSSLDKLEAKGKVTRGERDATLANVSFTTGTEEARPAGLVIEAVTEKLEVKRELFSRLDGICPAHTIFATNTSGLTVSSIASATARPDRVVGIHFFFPVPLVRFCEIMGGLLTSEATLEAAAGWVRVMGKEMVLVRKDHAGFLANRFSSPITVEALCLVDRGTATPEEIDRAAGGFEYGTGPLQLIDYTGLDTGLYALESIYNDSGELRFRPPPVLRRLVAAGLLGRKTGKGFYDYSQGRGRGYGSFIRTHGEPPDPAVLLQRMMVPGMLEAVRMLEAGVASAEDIDRAARLGLNLPAGQLEMADGMGLEALMEAATDLYGETGDPKFFPPPLLRRLAAAGMKLREY